MSFHKEIIKVFTVIALMFFPCASRCDARLDYRMISFDGGGNQVGIGLSNGNILVGSQPIGRISMPAESVGFSINVISGSSVGYQWRFNGIDIPGANTDSLYLPSISFASEGSYSVVITNFSGSVTSNPAFFGIDNSGNGLPDNWELAHFGNANQTSSGDFDGDGVSNRDEFLNGTDPTQPPALSISLVDDHVRIVIPSQIGVSYQLRQSPTLAPEAWQDVEQARIGIGPVLEFTAPAEGIGMFYQVRITPQP